MKLQLRVTKTSLYKIFYSIHIHVVLNNKHIIMYLYKAVRVLYNWRNKISYRCINYLLSAEMDRRRSIVESYLQGQWFSRVTLQTNKSLLLFIRINNYANSNRETCRG